MDFVNMLSVAKLEDTPMRDTALPITEAQFEAYDRYHKRFSLAALLVGGAALLFAIALTLYLLWLMVAPVRATAFDADGVRCYHRAVQVACIKTAEPAR